MTFTQFNEKLRGHDFYPVTLGITPALYSTEDVPIMEKTVFFHFFQGPMDWWIVEYEPESNIAFGFACLGDELNAEWGTVSLTELEALQIPLRVTSNGNGGADVLTVIERDLDFTPKTVREAIPAKFHRGWWEPKGK